ncbi:MAG: hypothetical protein KIT14_19110 [bacterium]|nr:hypothetical protein [bacterium]
MNERNDDTRRARCLSLAIGTRDAATPAGRTLHGLRSTAVTFACLAATTAGCGLSPSVNVLGSFFPAWLISIVTGLLLSLVVWRILVAAGVAARLSPPALVYPCLVATLIFATWLTLFAS